MSYIIQSLTGKIHSIPEAILPIVPLWAIPLVPGPEATWRTAMQKVWRKNLHVLSKWFNVIKINIDWVNKEMHNFWEKKNNYPTH